MDRAMITMGCFRSASGNGIVAGHAYSFIKVVKLSNGTRLVQVRNPWSVERYKGPWNDKDTRRWTEQFKQEAGFYGKDDGVFFTTIDIFQKDFGMVWVNYETRDLFRSSWLMLDDKTNSPGKDRNCGSRCTRHEFVLKSKVTQTIIVSASAWQDRGYPNKCKNGAKRGSKRHIFSVEGAGAKSFQTGTIMLDPFTMNAGDSIKMFIEMDYNREMAKDVSIVAWGDKGDICIEHTKGIESMRFPVLREPKRRSSDDSSDDDRPGPSPSPSPSPDPTPDPRPDPGPAPKKQCPRSGTKCKLYEKRMDHFPLPNMIVMDTADVDACGCQNALQGRSEVALYDGKFNGSKTTRGDWFGCPELTYMLIMSDDGREPQIPDFGYCGHRDG